MTRAYTSLSGYARTLWLSDIQDLARLVPALAHVRRLSKVLIVKESVKHFQQQRAMCIAAAQDMQELLSENQQLVSEINRLHPGQEGSRVPSVLVRPVSEAMAQLMTVPYEVLGAFPAGFGDNWTNDLSRHLLVRNEGDGLGAEPRSPLHDAFAPNGQPGQQQSPSPYEATGLSNSRLSPTMSYGGLTQPDSLLGSWHEASISKHGAQDVWDFTQPLNRQSRSPFSMDAELPQLSGICVNNQVPAELPARAIGPPVNSPVNVLSTTGTQIGAPEWTDQGNVSHLPSRNYLDLGDLTIPSYYAQSQFI